MRGTWRWPHLDWRWGRQRNDRSQSPPVPHSPQPPGAPPARPPRHKQSKRSARQSEAFRQQIKALSTKLSPTATFASRQQGAHGLAALLAANTEAYALLATLLSGGDVDILSNLLLLASEAERKRDVLTLQLVLSCLANYSFLCPAYVADSPAPALLASVFAPSSAAELPTIRDPKLHSYALAAIYNLRKSPHMLSLLAGYRGTLAQIAATPGLSATDLKHTSATLGCIDNINPENPHPPIPPPGPPGRHANVPPPPDPAPPAPQPAAPSEETDSTPPTPLSTSAAKAMAAFGMQRPKLLMLSLNGIVVALGLFALWMSDDDDDDDDSDRKAWPEDKPVLWSAVALLVSSAALLPAAWAYDRVFRRADAPQQLEVAPPPPQLALEEAEVPSDEIAAILAPVPPEEAWSPPPVPRAEALEQAFHDKMYVATERVYDKVDQILDFRLRAAKRRTRVGPSVDDVDDESEEPEVTAHDEEQGADLAESQPGEADEPSTRVEPPVFEEDPADAPRKQSIRVVADVARTTIKLQATKSRALRTPSPKEAESAGVEPVVVPGQEEPEVPVVDAVAVPETEEGSPLVAEAPAAAEPEPAPIQAPAAAEAWAAEPEPITAAPATAEEPEAEAEAPPPAPAEDPDPTCVDPTVSVPEAVEEPEVLILEAPAPAVASPAPGPAPAAAWEPEPAASPPAPADEPMQPLEAPAAVQEPGPMASPGPSAVEEPQKKEDAPAAAVEEPQKPPPIAAIAPTADHAPPSAAEAVPEVPPAAAPPKKRKKTQAERMAEMSAPRIRDDRIKPGCHVYKPPVRGLAYRGTEKMAMFQERRDGGMTYKHREGNEDGEVKLRLRETHGNEKLVLKDGETEGVARQRAIESASGIRKSNSNASAASSCSSAAGPSAPSRPGKRKPTHAAGSKVKR